jgi:hypothetical protein
MVTGKTILVSTDLRLESMIALRYALTLAKQASRGIQTWLVGKLHELSNALPVWSPAFVIDREQRLC